jgi:hypothetical protein
MSGAYFIAPGVEVIPPGARDARGLALDAATVARLKREPNIVFVWRDAFSGVVRLEIPIEAPR